MVGRMPIAVSHTTHQEAEVRVPFETFLYPWLRIIRQMSLPAH